MKKIIGTVVGLSLAAALSAAPVMASTAADDLVSGLSELLGSVSEQAGAIGNDALGVAQDALSGIQDALGGAQDTIGENAAQIAQDAVQAAQDAVQQAAQDALGESKEDSVSPDGQALLEQAQGLWECTGTQINGGDIRNAFDEIIIARDKIYVNGTEITYTLDGNQITVSLPTEEGTQEESGTIVLGDYVLLGRDSDLKEEALARLEADPMDGLTLTLEMANTSDPLVVTTDTQIVYARKGLDSWDVQKFLEYYLGNASWTLDSGVVLTFGEEVEDDKTKRTVTTSGDMSGTWYVSTSAMEDNSGWNSELRISWESSSTSYMIDMNSITATSFTMSQKDNPSVVISAELTEE